MTKPPRRIGILGGTFDPVHFGHLRPALELIENNALDTLHLVPNHRPAHRQSPTATTAQRLKMLSLATESVTGLVVDDREAQRDKPSYTVDTLLELQQEYPQATLVFFMGVDAFDQFHSWHRWETILDIAHIVVMERPGASLGEWATTLIENQQREIGNIHSVNTGAIERQHVTQLAISATEVRKGCKAGRSVRFLLPESVRQYIIEHGIYT